MPTPIFILFLSLPSSPLLFFSRSSSFSHDPKTANTTLLQAYPSFVKANHNHSTTAARNLKPIQSTKTMQTKMNAKKPPT